MPLPPQNIRTQRRRTQATLVALKAEKLRREAEIPDDFPDPVNPTKVWKRVDKGDYWEITDPDGNVYKVNKEQDWGQGMEDFLDDHLTWGNLFKLGLIGVGGAIFLGGMKIQREDSNGQKKT
jgi:hypothetical protein